MNKSTFIERAEQLPDGFYWLMAEDQGEQPEEGLVKLCLKNLVRGIAVGGWDVLYAPITTDHLFGLLDCFPDYVRLIPAIELTPPKYRMHVWTPEYDCDIKLHEWMNERKDLYFDSCKLASFTSISIPANDYRSRILRALANIEYGAYPPDWPLPDIV